MKYIISIFIFLCTLDIYSQSEPTWINNFPVNDRFYTGIGSSNSGNKSDDYERALIQARLNLASEISTSIKAETQIVTTDSSSEGFSQSFTEKLNQSVEQYLKEIEIVDTYYSVSQGYWIYIRLNKNKWNEIQRDEMQALLERIRQLLNNDYFNRRSTTADKLFKLASAAEALNESPYSTILRGELGSDYSGVIHDFIISEIFRISSQISISSNTDQHIISSGESLELRLLCSSGENYTGKLPFSILNEDLFITQIYSDINGNIRSDIASNELGTGNRKLQISLDPQKIGFYPESIYFESFITEKLDLTVIVQSVSISLSVIDNRDSNSFSRETVSTLFSDGNNSFNLTDNPSDATYELIFTMNYTDYPRVIENAPLMAGLECIITLKKGNNLLYEYKAPAVKDGGLTYNQAYDRTFNKLIASLRQNREYMNAIEREINR